MFAVYLLLGFMFCVFSIFSPFPFPTTPQSINSDFSFRVIRILTIYGDNLQRVSVTVLEPQLKTRSLEGKMMQKYTTHILQTATRSYTQHRYASTTLEWIVVTIIWSLLVDEQVQRRVTVVPVHNVFGRLHSL
jgi:hypothetical protein